MTPEKHPSIGAAVAAVGALSRKEELTFDEAVELGQSLINLMSKEDLWEISTAADALALVALARESHRALMRSHSVQPIEEEYFLAVSCGVDRTLGRAIDALVKLTGQTAEPYAWGKRMRLQ